MMRLFFFRISINENFDPQSYFSMRYRLAQLLLVLLIIVTNNCLADFGKNETGLKIGYFNPNDFDAYFPIQSDELADYVRYDNAILGLFYDRNVNSGLDFGVELGFTGVLDNSDHNTILNSYPISIYLVGEVLYLYGINIFAGGGLNYWYMESKDNGMQGIPGYHLKMSMKYQIYRFDLIHSKIDNFGNKKEDLGGTSIKLGVAYTFSYK